MTARVSRLAARGGFVSQLVHMARKLTLEYLALTS